MEQALKGNLRAVEDLIKWAQGSHADTESETEDPTIGPTDRAILQQAFEQMREAATATRREGGAS